MIHSACASRSHSTVSAPELLARIGCEDFKVVDLSDLNLYNLPDVILDKSDKIEHLILDENHLTEEFLEDACFPNLKSLSLNSNNIKNIRVFLQFISWKCPKLVFLSLIGNPGWPHPILCNNAKLYQNCVKTVCKFLPKLQFVDSIPTPNFQKSSNHIPECRIA
uniref:Uncharacterized protein n=1 Tax=Panagrolaimus sp. ES5 TaxID=591445 RepID=A0AC34GWE3_9BILA